MILFWAEREIGFDTSEIDAKLWIDDISPRPVFLMQGGTDEYISVGCGEWLYEAAKEPKELWYEEEVGHASFEQELPQEYEERVVAFFDRHLLGE